LHEHTLDFLLHGLTDGSLLLHTEELFGLLAHFYAKAFKEVKV